MRILIAGPPKTGNVWVEKILATAYDLERLNLKEAHPLPLSESDLGGYIEDGFFPEGAILHQHFAPWPELLKVADVEQLTLVTPIRDPYDTFVSLYHYVQGFADTYPDADPAAVMAGKPIDHPDVFRYLRDSYGDNLEVALGWVRSGRSQIVRYEDLHRAPDTTVRRLTDAISPAGETAVAAAISSSSADAMRAEGELLNRHIRSARTGDWRIHLDRRHLQTLRGHADAITELGYRVI